MTLPEWIKNTEKGIVLMLLIQPKASRSEVVGPHGVPPRLKIRIAAPPVDGEANEEVIRFLKKALRIPASQIAILRGQSSKQKDVLCVGKSAEEIVTQLHPKVV
ncbi:DUF167 domain-containing protein [Bdellovibrionota bacterium FG-1]